MNESQFREPAALAAGLVQKRALVQQHRHRQMPDASAYGSGIDYDEELIQ